MPQLTLLPSSISFLTHLVFLSIVTGYFTLMVRRKNRPAHVHYLFAFCVACTSFTLVQFLQSSTHLAWHLYFLYLQNTAIWVAVIFFLQFVYQFPSLPSEWETEARWVRILTTAMLMLELVYTGDRFARLWGGGMVESRPPIMDVPLLAAFVWAFVMLLRKENYHNSPLPADLNGRQLWKARLQRMFLPPSRPARTCRSLAWIVFCLIGLSLASNLPSGFVFSSQIDPLLSIAILLAASSFVLAYLSDFPEDSSFLVKLVGTTLVVAFLIVGIVSWLMEPVFNTLQVAQPLRSQYSLRFTPNKVGGYDLREVPFQWYTQVSQHLTVMRDNTNQLEPLPFGFRFFDKTWREAYIADDGYISFGKSLRLLQDAEYNYGSMPAIMALLTDLNPGLDARMGVFTTSTPDYYVITWTEMPVRYRHQDLYSFQLVLYPDHSFDINYLRVPAIPVEARSLYRWVVGVTPGGVWQPVRYLRLQEDLPQSFGVEGAVEDYQLEVRRAIHQVMTPLAYLVLLSSLVVLIAAPIWFRSSLMRPLTTLLTGIRQVEAGDLKTPIPVSQTDEISHITRAFNEMMRSVDAAREELRFHRDHLEELVAERTQALEAEINERQRAELQLEAWSALLQATLDSSQQGIVVIDNTQRIQVTNPLARELIPDPIFWEPQLIGERMLQLADVAEKPDVLDKHLKRLRAHPEINSELRLELKNGRVFELTSTPYQVNGSPQGRVWTVQDVTERERVAREQILADERRRMAQQLHEGVLQSLVGLRFRIGRWRRMVTLAPDKMEGELDFLDETLDYAVSDLRQLVFALRPTLLEEYGFLPALERLALDVQRTYYVDVHVSFAGPLDCMPQRLEMPVFQLVQEALANLGKHARATHAWVELELQTEERMLRVQVRDDGSGFDTQQVKAGYGLRHLRERVHEIDGSLNIISALGEGTCLETWIPLKQDDCPPLSS